MPHVVRPSPLAAAYEIASTYETIQQPKRLHSLQSGCLANPRVGHAAFLFDEIDDKAAQRIRRHAESRRRPYRGRQHVARAAAFTDLLKEPRIS